MFKNFLPRTIFFRYLLIIITPVLLLQIILTVVFFDSLWIKTNKGLVRALAGEINTLVEVYSDPKAKKDFDFVKSLDLFKKYEKVIPHKKDIAFEISSLVMKKNEVSGNIFKNV